MSDPQLAELLAENALLRQEVRVAREAARITADVVVKQFAETERVLARLQSVSEEREAVLDAASQVAVVATDRAGLVQLFNTGAENLLGWKADQVVGKLPATFFHLETELASRAQSLSVELRRIVSPAELFFVYAETERAEVREWTWTRRDGSSVLVDESVTALRGPSGDLNGFLCVAIDLTARKRAEEEIRAAMEAIEAANRTKSAFLANMSHELRTPLNAIIGYSEMLMEEAEEAALPSFVKDLQRIRVAGRHLLGLINDILDISKIEAGKIELYLEELSVAELVAEVSRTAEPLVQKNANVLAVACDEVGTMRADALRVRQILFNLLSNACKFTERGSIGLHVWSEGDQIVFRVSDSGIGMDEAQLARLFQPFVQADASTTRKYGGTGLGLAISKQFCEMMGGTIAVASTIGAGTTFTVRLPRRTEKAPAAPSLAPPPRELPKHGKVLVIDDDPVVRDLLARYLEKEGFAVVSAPDGDTGLSLARSERPDVITLDVLMPGRDGWSVLAELKSDAGTHDIPVVMLTIIDQRNAGYALGASDYLMKPVDRTRLLQVLERYRPAGGPSGTVLVVEDDLDVRALLTQSLVREGWTVREAANGQEALDWMEREAFGVVLLDLMMPVMDGFEFLERIRGRPELRAVPIVVVTAMELSEPDRLKLTGYVEKVIAKASYQRPELLGEVRRLLEVGLESRQSSVVSRQS